VQALGPALCLCEGEGSDTADELVQVMGGVNLRALVLLALLPGGAFAQSIGGGGGGGGPSTVTANQGTANTAANTWPFFATVGGSAISATNGLYSNLLQGNAVLSATNGLYSNILQGNAVLSLTNPLPTSAFIQPMTNAQGGSIAPIVSAALEASHTFKATAANVYSVYASTQTGAAGWLVCVNGTSISAGAITPLDAIPMPAGPSVQGFELFAGADGFIWDGNYLCCQRGHDTVYIHGRGSLWYYHGLVN
jgi:hypothetical protein